MAVWNPAIVFSGANPRAPLWPWISNGCFGFAKQEERFIPKQIINE
jgi:hypothetical protein